MDGGHAGPLNNQEAKRRMPSQTVDEKTQNKGQVRKLNALRKSVGAEIARPGLHGMDVDTAGRGR